MIVKDEEAILPRCLASVAPFIDHWVIADTGSTDKTPELIADFFASRAIPGELVRFPFTNFEQARNDALAAARAAQGKFDYILLTDADMELVVDDDAFRSQLKEPAHLVRQVAGITYDNVRFVHRDLPAKYVGVTHEYLDTCGVTATRVDGVWFLDHAEGSSRSVKSQRDAKLLRGGLKKEPNNARYMFYLAQTYKDLERFEAAISWYERRIEAGGYAEEVWYAAYMIAYCRKALGQTDLFIAAALRAYQMRPTRAEPLYMLAKHHREKGENALAVLMSEAGEKISLPDDHLFLETFPYEWGFQHELAITGFYSHHAEVRERGYELCMDLATDAEAPGFVRHTAVDNTQHYAVLGKVAFGDSFRTYPLQIAPLAPGLFAMNPSVTLGEDGSLLAIVRWVNYNFSKSGYFTSSGRIQTQNETVRLSLETDCLHVTERAPWVDCTNPDRAPHARVLGYEDCRLFRWRGAWWAMATVRDRRPDALAEIALLSLESPIDSVGPDMPSVIRAYHVQRDVVAADRHEKNWVPLVRGNDLFFVYESDPTLILQVDPATRRASMLMASLPEPVLKNLRGSSQAVPFEVNGANGFLYVTHEAFENGHRRRYTHRLVWIDGVHFDIQYVSDPFFFVRQDIEFCAGLAVRGSDVIMSFGVADTSAWLAVAERAAVIAWLLTPTNRRSQRHLDQHDCLAELEGGV